MLFVCKYAQRTSAFYAPTPTHRANNGGSLSCLLGTSRNRYFREGAETTNNNLLLHFSF